MEGNFFEPITGRLREIKVVTRQTADGRGSVSFRNFLIEFPLNAKITIGKLLGVKTLEEDYLLLEIADFLPVHYGMINLDSSIPKEIRDEIMRKVEESWGKDESESWLEVYAYPVGYLFNLRQGKFIKGYVPPIPGSVVHILSRDAYKQFVCIPDGINIGKIIGEDLDLTINLEKALTYHIGVFAFTGSGKSNLSAVIIRRALSKGVKVVIFDISMEYAVLLLDQLLTRNSRLITLDRLPANKVDVSRRFLRTHVIPEEMMKLRRKLSIAFRRYFPQIR
ncbi:helicase HerA domain-containing protein [Acidianus sp. RZ1]|uniref:helicase HerA domain-containing protein n=1 Tax=Acidianus sp. RZ1 TaxID=1540082 RepID=UPI0014924F8E|nr:DUF87 domain-containing protein [Acidianus sp. RZ1]NON62055.1 DUF87 domain-containing protein [Acidianus sp. RZ1]